MQRRNHFDAEARWKCCPVWQRKLRNKWNSRQFAIRLGLKVPDLYWAGEDVRALPLETLPSEYVIRFCSGHSSHQVWVMDGEWELLRNRLYSSGELRNDLLITASAYPYRPFVMVEEKLRRSDGSPGLLDDYGFHVFGNQVAFIAVRRGIDKFAYYLPEWQPVPFQVYRKWQPGQTEYIRPERLAEMIAWATRYGNAFGSYVRVDLYHTDKGTILSELAPTPCSGRCYTKEADQFLGSLWESHFPDSV